MSEQFEFCEECNNPLSQCGPQGPDGIPTMDCLVCHLRDLIAEKDAEIAKLKKSFLQSQDARQGWLREFDGYKKTILLQQQRLSEAMFIIERIGTTDADRPEVIRAAENWLKSKP